MLSSTILLQCDVYISFLKPSEPSVKMPPKKKKSGKKKGKKSGKGSAVPVGGPEVDELSKDFFYTQIRDLENRIAR